MLVVTAMAAMTAAGAADAAVFSPLYIAGSFVWQGFGSGHTREEVAAGAEWGCVSKVTLIDDY
jgi:hypothetical protein